MPRLLPAGAFRLGRGLPTVVVLRGVLAGAFFGTETFIPLMLVEQRSLRHDPGRRLADRRRADLVARRLAAGPAGAADAALGAGDCSASSSCSPASGWSRWPTSDAVPAVTAAVGWVVAGLGMGLGLTSLSVLVLELSPVAEQGVNASALQVSDALGSIIMIGTAGAVFAALATGARTAPRRTSSSTR